MPVSSRYAIAGYRRRRDWAFQEGPDKEESLFDSSTAIPLARRVRVQEVLIWDITHAFQKYQLHLTYNAYTQK